MGAARAYLGFAAGVLLLVASIPYIRSILRGATKPSRTSWAIWTLLGLVLLASYQSSGASDTIWLAAGYFLIPLVVLLLALRHGEAGFARLDAICLAGASLGVAAWAAFKSAPLAVFICIAVDACGAIPTVRKAYADPFSEDLLAWALGFAASLVNLLAIGDWAPHISLYPLYAAISTGTIALVLLVRRRALLPEPGL